MSTPLLITASVLIETEYPGELDLLHKLVPPEHLGGGGRGGKGGKGRRLVEGEETGGIGRRPAGNLGVLPRWFACHTKGCPSVI